MFFIGIVGMNRKDKKIRDTQAPCPVCHDESKKWVIKREKRFTFFFIPLFHWGAEYFVICEKCKSVFAIAKDRGEKHEGNTQEELTYWDLKVIKKGTVEKKCPDCQATLTGDHIYCHQCGRKL